MPSRHRSQGQLPVLYGWLGHIISPLSIIVTLSSCGHLWPHACGRCFIGLWVCYTIIPHCDTVWKAVKMMQMVGLGFKLRMLGGLGSPEPCCYTQWDSTQLSQTSKLICNLNLEKNKLDHMYYASHPLFMVLSHYTFVLPCCLFCCYRWFLPGCDSICKHGLFVLMCI